MSVRLFVGFVLALSLATSCGKRKTGLATLTKAEGPVERQRNGEWAAAKIGSWFHLGDAARTADGAAELTIAGAQLIRMDPHSVLRFATGSSRGPNIQVELGAFDVLNTGQVGVEIGSVKIAPGGKVHITASKAELIIGAAQVQSADGSVIDLEVGTPRSLDSGRVEVVRADAARPADAGVEAGPGDASPVGEGAEYEIAGAGAERSSDGKQWTAVPEGKGTIAVGSRLRLKKAGTTARLVSHGMSLELSGASSQIAIRDNLLLGVEQGVATATVPAATKGTLAVPGGQVEIIAPPGASGQARLDVSAKGDANVAVIHGAAKLVTSAASLEMATGETAAVVRAGAIHPGVVVPKYFDFQIVAGETARALWIHDGKGATAIQFSFNGKCPGTGTIEADRDTRFRTPRISEGKDVANILFPAGTWHWRLRCGAESLGGRVTIVRDSGRRPLPPNPSKNHIDADGRNYTIAYQSLIPVVAVHAKGSGTKFTLHVASAGTEQVFDAESPTVEIPSGKLKEGSYALWFERDGVRQDKITTLRIAFDQTAAQVYIESPVDGQPFGDEVPLAGAALPGWTAAFDGIEIPVIETATRRFKARVPRPRSGAQALAIRLSHPQLGTHYYLRREN